MRKGFKNSFAAVLLIVAAATAACAKDHSVWAPYVFWNADYKNTNEQPVRT